ncbi:MAG TPA: ferritin-like domain-containing protein, partial [Actinomycetospora sp.]|nr:ferritin-like domain-containing protein [Actinomycetospora sp.]
MTAGPRSAAPLDLAFLGFEQGAHLLVARALRGVPVGGRVVVTGGDPALGVHLRAWARRQGHGFTVRTDRSATFELVRGPAELQRWQGAERAGGPGVDGIVDRPPARWGLAARGALVEPGATETGFDIDRREVVWADLAPRLYAH